MAMVMAGEGVKYQFMPGIHQELMAGLKMTPVEGRTGRVTYMITDKGPQAQWLKEIGKLEDGSCPCDGWTPQNAAHLYACPWVGDGKGRTREMLWGDEKWCEDLARFLS